MRLSQHQHPFLPTTHPDEEDKDSEGTESAGGQKAHRPHLAKPGGHVVLAAGGLRWSRSPLLPPRNLFWSPGSPTLPVSVL